MKEKDNRNNRREKGQSYTISSNRKEMQALESWRNASGIHNEYILDHPETVAGRRVLDVGCGCGAGAIAAAVRNAQRVVANDIDPCAVIATEINAKLNNTKVETDTTNFIGSGCDDFDVVLIGDMFYDEEFSRILFGWLNKLTEDSKLVLIGDPGRHGLTAGRRSQMRVLASYELPRECREQNHGFTDTAVWTVHGEMPKTTAI